jgi:hypothetical protein
LSLVTSCARAGDTANHEAASKPAAIRKCALMPSSSNSISLARLNHNIVPARTIPRDLR